MAVAPVAPAAGELAVALALFLAFLVAYGLLQVYRSTLGAILRGLADELDGIAVNLGFHTVHLFGPVSDALRYVDRKIDHGLALAVGATERSATWLFETAAHQLEQLGDAIGGLAYDVEAALAHTVTVAVPNAVYAAQHGLGRQLSQLRAEAAVAARAGTAAVHHLEAVLGERIGRVERGASRTLGRVIRAERSLAGAGAVVLVTAALARAGLGWVRCRNVGRVARRVCGMDYDLLESLLADTLLVVGTVSLVALAEELLAVEDELAGLVMHGFRETRGLA